MDKLWDFIIMIGGLSLESPITSIKAIYNDELSDVSYSAKIELMYASDYGFAASPNYWNLPGYQETNGNDI